MLRRNTRSSSRTATIQRASGITLAAAIMVLLAAGCGSPTTSTKASDTTANQTTAADTPLHEVQLAAATAKTMNSVTAKISISMSAADGATVKDMPQHYAGTISARFRPALYENLDYPDASIAHSQMPGGIQEILTPSSLYLKAAAFSQVIHTPWMLIPRSSLTQASNADFRPLVQEARNDSPLTQIQMLAAASYADPAGTSILDGVPVTEYTGTYNITSALRLLPASIRTQVAQAAAEDAIGFAKYYVWVDASHQPRKVISDWDGIELNETMTLVITGINKPVTQYLPPASEVSGIPRGA